MRQGVIETGKRPRGVKEMDMSGYATFELKSAVDLDAYAVRKEAEKRAEKAAKSIARAKAAIAKAEAEIKECEAAIRACYA
jgi:hypothetical protein